MKTGGGAENYLAGNELTLFMLREEDAERLDDRLDGGVGRGA